MQLISQLCEPNLNALLYGVTDLPGDTNRQLFILIQDYMGLVARKPVFGVSVKASFKPVSSATETS